MEISSIQKNNKKNISLIIDAIIKIINNKEMLIENTEYYYHHNKRIDFLYTLYLLKLVINNNDYIAIKYKHYLLNIKKKVSDNTAIGEIATSKISNIPSKNVLDLIKKIKKLLLNSSFIIDNNKLIFNDNNWVDLIWLCTFLALILDGKEDNSNYKDINICYTIPKKNIKKVSNSDELIDFFSQFIFYNIKVKYTDQTKQIKENNVLIIKNAAINYLKHLKQYKYGLESEELYLIFYKLLKNECNKQGFILEEEVGTLNKVNNKYLKQILKYITDDFYNYQLSKQVHILENIIWQLSNDLTMLEYINSYFDSTLELISVLNKKGFQLTYKKLKETKSLHEIRALMIILIQKFSLIFLFNSLEIDYSLLNLIGIKPAYMNNIGDSNEENIKNKIKDLELEINSYKASIEKCKETRQNLNKDILGLSHYQEELERCVSKMNRASINIATLNSNMASLKKEYEIIKNSQKEKYNNIELYNYNHSIIKHMCNSITCCSFYLKTNNNINIMDNVIVFEDYIKSDNAFYLEITFKDLLKISNINIITAVEEKNDLPKLSQS